MALSISRIARIVARLSAVVLPILLVGMLVRADQQQSGIGTWSPAGDMGALPAGAASAVLRDGRLVIAGGAGTTTPRRLISVFDSTAWAWSAAGSLIAGRSDAAAASLKDGRLVILGGTTANGITGSVEIFDSSTGTSTEVGVLGAARTGAAAAALEDGTVLIVGGSDGSVALSSAEIFDPATGTATTLANPLVSARQGASATRLLTGHVVIAGGNDGFHDLASAELFHPETQTFTTMASSLGTARRNHAALLLPNNGGVLIAGGTSGGQALNSVELLLPAAPMDPFDFVEGTFHATAPMTDARVGGVATTTQADGIALAGGGFGLTTAEAYHFATVKTDKDDYAPGETVTITGTGWVPGETVQLSMVEKPTLDTHPLVAVVADANGNIVSAEFSPDEHDVNIRFYLTATGSASVAQNTFTDAKPNTVAVSPGSVTVSPGGSAVYTVTVGFNGNGNPCTTLPLTTSALPAGATASFSPTTVTTASPTTTLTISTTAATAVGSPTFTVTATNGGGTCQIGSATSAGTTLVVAAKQVGTVTVGSQAGALTYGTGSSSTYTVTVNRNGATGSALSADLSLTTSLPGGASGSFSPSTVNFAAGDTSKTSTLTITTGASTPASSTPFTVQASNPAVPGDLSIGDGTLLVGQRLVTASVAAGGKTYDGNVTATITSCSLTGVLAGDSADLTCSAAGPNTFPDKNVGTGRTVTATNISLSGTAAGNYQLSSTSATTTANIDTRALTVSATGIDKLYDGTAAATVTLTDDRVSGDVFTDSYSGATFTAGKAVGTGKAISVAGISISGADASNYTFNTTASTTANITARSLTIAAHGVNKVYDGTATATVTLTDDRVSGDAFTDNYTGATFTGGSAVGTGKAVSVAGISISGTDAGNYTYNTTATTTADITALHITGSFTASNKIYDGNASATVLTRAVSGTIGGDAVSLTGGTASFPDKNVGTGRTVTLSGATLAGGDAGNYILDSVATTTANIDKANPTISVTPYNVTYTGTAHVATGTATGVLSESLAGLDLSGTSHTNAGDYPSDPWTFTDVTGNYNNTSGSTHDSIAKAVASVTVSGYTGVYDAAAHGATGSATGVGGVDLGAGLNFGSTFTNVPGGTAHWTFTGGTNYTDQAGDVSIVITQAGSTTIVTVSDATYDSAPHGGTAAATGVNLNQVLAVSYAGRNATVYGPSATAPTTAGDYSASAAFGGDTNHTGSSDSKPYTIHKATTSATISSSNASSVVGEPVTFAIDVADSSAGSTGTPTGTVTVSDGAAAIAIVTLNGSSHATFTSALLSSAGSPHAINAHYNGDANFQTSDATPTSQAVSTRHTTTTLNFNPTTGTFGTADTITATVTDTELAGPTGTPDTFAAAPGGLGTARFSPTATRLLDGRVLVAGGTSSGAGLPLATAEIYDPAAGVSTPAHALVGRRGQSAAARLADGRVLIVGGVTAESFNTGEIYDPVTNTSTAAGSAMSTGRVSPTATLLANGTVAIIGGLNSGTWLASVEIFDPAANGGAGGFSTPGAGTGLSNGRAFHVAAILPSGKILIAGGRDASGVIASAELYDPATNTSTATGNLTVVRENASGAAMENGYVLVAGGSNGTAALTTTELYDPSAGTFVAASATLGTARSGAGTALLNDGRVLAIGGRPNINMITASTTAQFYTPAFTPQGMVSLGSSGVPADLFGATCQLAPVLPTTDGVLSTCSTTITPQSAGDRTVTGGYTADAVHAGSSASPTFHVNKAQPSFTNLSTSQTITYGHASITLSGTISAGSLYPSTSETVDIEINGAHATAPIGASGAFSTSFDTHAIPASVSAYTITYTFAADSTFFGASDASTTLTVNRKSVTPAITVANRVYDGTNAATLATCTVSVIANSDDVYCTGSGTFEDKHVGTSKTVTATGLALAGAAASNYTLSTTSATTTADITPLSIDVTAVTDSRVYNGTTSSTGVPTIAPALMSGDTSGFSQTFDTKHAGTNKTLTASGHVNDGNSGNDYSVTFHTVNTGTITTLPITVTAATDSKPYDGGVLSSASPSITSGALAAGDVGQFRERFDSKNVGTNKTLIPTGRVMDSGASDVTADYDITFTTNTTGAITALTVTPHIVANSKPYDGNDTATLSSQTVTGVLPVDEANVGLAVGASHFDTPNAGTGKTVTASGLSLTGSEAGNYILSTTSASAPANINKANATIVVTPYSVAYDGNAHTAAGSATGVLGESLSGLDLGGTTHTGAGTYTADAWTFTDVTGNYNNGGGVVSDTINRAGSATTVTFETGPYVYRGTAFTATANVSGVGGLNEPVAVVYSGDCANVTSANGCTATATFAGDANHDGSTNSQSITITQAGSTTVVTVSDAPYDGNPHGGTAGVTGIGGLSQSVPVKYVGRNATVYGPSNTAPTEAGDYTAQARFIGDANHATSNDAKDFSITKAASTTSVTCPPSAVFTGAAITPCSVTVTGAGGLSLTPAAGYASNVNVGVASASYTFAGDANHSGSSDSKTFNITPASSTTTVTCPASAVFTGAAISPCSVTVTGAGGLSLAPAADYANNVSVGTASASFAFAGDANHSGSSDSKTFAITPAPTLTVVACPATALHTWSPVTPCTAGATGAGLNMALPVSYANNINIGMATANAAFAGDANHSGSLGSTTFQIVAAPPITQDKNVEVIVRPYHNDSDDDDRRDHDEYDRRRNDGHGWNSSGWGDNDDDTDKQWEDDADGGRAVRVTLTATDVDSTKLTFRIVTPPAHGALSRVKKVSCTLDGHGGSTCSARVIYFSELHYSGGDTFTYAANDGANDSNFATVTVNLVPPFTTFSQGEWGSNPTGANPGAFLAANFAGVYGATGVTIGNGLTLKFTSAAAIKTFLPAGGKAGALTVSAVNPSSSKAGVFAGQVLALQLSVDFSNAGKTRVGLAARKLSKGPLKNYTVGQVLNLANQALGGNTSALTAAGVSLSTLNDIIASMNDNFDRGKEDDGLLIQ